MPKRFTMKTWIRPVCSLTMMSEQVCRQEVRRCLGIEVRCAGRCRPLQGKHNGSYRRVLLSQATRHGNTHLVFAQIGSYVGNDAVRQMELKRRMTF